MGSGYTAIYSGLSVNNSTVPLELTNIMNYSYCVTYKILHDVLNGMWMRQVQMFSQGVPGLYILMHLSTFAFSVLSLPFGDYSPHIWYHQKPGPYGPMTKLAASYTAVKCISFYKPVL